MGYSDDINLFIKEYIATSQLYNTNDHIFTQGESFHGVYYILEGSVKILKNNHNQPLMLWVGEANEFIGITSYFDNSDSYQFSAVASGLNCKLIYIPSDKFSESLNKIPGIKEEIIKVFCKRINFVELRINNHIQHSTRQRFIDTISFIFKHLNFSEKNKSLKGPVLRYSINDLSEMVGTSKRSLSKLINEYEHNNLLQVQGDIIIIHDISKFREIAEV
jgi:CRP-like cAMP-binding protein